MFICNSALLLPIWGCSDRWKMSSQSKWSVVCIFNAAFSRVSPGVCARVQGKVGASSVGWCGKAWTDWGRWGCRGNNLRKDSRCMVRMHFADAHHEKKMVNCSVKAYPALQQKTFLFLTCSAIWRNDLMTVLNEKNVIIDGFHLFLLVCIIRDSTACQNDILIYCSCFISIFYLYIKYDSIWREFRNFFIQNSNNCNCFMFSCCTYHVLVCSTITFVFKSVNNVHWCR